MRSIFLLVMLIASSLMYSAATAQDALKISGPKTASPGQLVRLDVDLADSESALWIVQPDDLDYEIVGHRILFALGPVKKVNVLVIAARVENDVVQFRQCRHRVTLEDSEDEPIEPDPVPKPDEPTEPDGDQPMQDWSAVQEWVKENRPPEDRATARALASGFRRVAGQVRQLTIEQARQQAGSMRRTVFSQRTDFTTDWNPFLVGLDAVVAAAPPNSTNAFATLLVAIADGLEVVGQATAEPVADSNATAHLHLLTAPPVIWHMPNSPPVNQLCPNGRCPNHLLPNTIVSPFLTNQ